MSDPRDELLDRIQEELRRIPAVIQRTLQGQVDVVHGLVKSWDSDPRKVEALSRQIDTGLVRAAGLALGQCVGIAETLVLEIERLKRERSKTGSG